MSRIWLSGKSSNEVFLYDTDSGAHHRFPNRSYVGATAGDMSRLSRMFVATYVDEKREAVWLQVGPTRYPLDERTEATTAKRLGGLVTTLTVSSVGLPPVTVSHSSPARRIYAIAKLIGSVEARETFRAVKDPAGGPGIEWVRGGGVKAEPSLS